MPINEAGAFRRSNLTKEQKREAEAAIYGLSAKDMEQQFSQEDIERMRAILQQHDAQHKGGIREFDLNNPPKEPYVFQEFPKLVYHHDQRKHKPVHSRKDEKAALDDGWKLTPFPAELPEEDLDEADAAEVARLDKLARKKKQPAE